MKIQSIQNYESTNKKQTTVQNHYFKTNPNLCNDSFEITFGGYWQEGNIISAHWRNDVVRNLITKQDGLKEVAEAFHKSNNDILEQVTHLTLYKKQEVKVKKFFGLIKKDELESVFDKEATTKANKEAFDKLTKAIEEVVTHKNKISSEVSQLELKSLRGNDNTTTQQVRIQKLFGRLIEIEKEGVKVEVPNGIFVHGTSNEKNNDFIKWIVKNTPVFFDEENTVIKHNPQKPMETIAAIISKAEDAKNLFKTTGNRTLLLIENLDEMLSDYSTIEKRGIIARFKGFVEHISKDYHTTLVMKTSKPLEDFEPASVASNRFEIKVPIKDGITEEETRKLEDLKAKLDRLNEKADNVKCKYWEEEYQEPGEWIETQPKFDPPM